MRWLTGRLLEAEGLGEIVVAAGAGGGLAALGGLVGRGLTLRPGSGKTRALAAVRGLSPATPNAARAAAPAMAVMIAIYAVAYLATPYDVAWQLKTSLDRVVVHIVPTLAWSMMTMSR